MILFSANDRRKDFLYTNEPSQKFAEIQSVLVGTRDSAQPGIAAKLMKR